MILTVGSPDAISFTDDTSLPNVGAKVSIHTQVIRGQSLDWYYMLLQRASSRCSELKSTAIVEVFFTLPDFERRKVLNSLNRVRIHITDPRPYAHQVDEFLADIVPGGDFHGSIERLDSARRQFAEDRRHWLIAQRMMGDSPSQQIRLKHFLWECCSGLRISRLHLEPAIVEQLTPDVVATWPTEFDLTPFERSRKNMINVLSPFLSKSESVFCEVLDGMDEFFERHTWSPMLGALRLSRILSASHAFDAGDTQEVEWIDGERHDLLRRVHRYGGFQVQPAPLSELDSKSSFFVQAADFAAGIARELWSRNSLPHLVETFDYVTYNGRRISASAAAAVAADLAKRGRTTN